MLKKPIRIAVDMDEVLFPLLRPMLRHSNIKQPMSKKYPYDYSVIMNRPREEAQKVLYEYYDSKEFNMVLPIHGSQQAIHNFKKNGYDLYVLTGRQDRIRDKTEDWLKYWFPNTFTDVILTDSYTSKEVSKVDVCKNIGAGLIIDDSFETCVKCLDEGVSVINYIGFPVYPWCEYNQLSICSWYDIEKRFFDGSPVPF